MSKLSRTKGATFERLIAAILRDIWPEARRGIGQARSAKEVPDVDGTPYWPELKHKRNVSIGAAMKQAQNDTDGRPPIVISRENRGPILVTMEIEVFLRLAKDSHDLRSVCVTAAHAAELDAADKALREAAERLEPVDAGPALAARMEAVWAQHQRPDTAWHSLFDEYVDSVKKKTGTEE